MALPGEMIDFSGPYFGEDSAQGRSISQVAIMQEEMFRADALVPAEMLDPRTLQITRAPNQSMDRVALIKKQLRQIRAILARNPCDQSGLALLTHLTEREAALMPQASALIRYLATSDKLRITSEASRG